VYEFIAVPLLHASQAEFVEESANPPPIVQLQKYPRGCGLI
jgi:hypothetical protein